MTLTENGVPASKILLNPSVGPQGVRNFQELGTLLPGLDRSSAAWSDVDKDGDLDLVLSGAQGKLGSPYLQLFRNTQVDLDSNGLFSGTPNNPPQRTTAKNLKQEMLDSGSIKLSWDRDDSNEPPGTFNLRLGTYDGRAVPDAVGNSGRSLNPNAIVASQSLENGQRLISEAGNVGYAKQLTLTTGSLQPGQAYSWSVQDVDHGFLGSVFSSASAFVVNPLANSAIDLTASFSIAANAASMPEGNTGTTAVSFTVKRSGNTDAACRVRWAVKPDSSNGISSDELGGSWANSWVDFATGETSKTISINVLADTTVESNETLTIVLMYPEGGALDIDPNRTQARVTLTNDDTTWLITPSAPFIQEGGSGYPTPYNFTINRSGDCSSKLSLSWAVSGTGTESVNASDFASNFFLTDTIEFLPNHESASLSLNIAGDTQVEANERLQLTLSNGSQILTSTSGLILNDDYDSYGAAQTPGLVITKDSPDQREGNTSPANSQVFRITRTGDTRSTSSVKVNIAAAPGSSFTAADIGGTSASTISFAAGESTKYFTVTPAIDSIPEPDEAFQVSLSDASGAVIAANGGMANGVILNDDTALSIQPLGADKSEGSSRVTDTTTLSFLVQRNGLISGRSSANWSVAGSGTQPANTADFGGSLPSGTVSFEANETAKIINISIARDYFFEADETFTVSLSNASGGVIDGSASSATGTIRNDDILIDSKTADFNNDGWLDRFDNDGLELRLYLSKNNGIMSEVDFDATKTGINPWALSVKQLDVADLNSDGRLDVVALYRTTVKKENQDVDLDRVSIFFNHASGLSNQQSAHFGIKDSDAFSIDATDTSSRFNAFALLDADLDGRLDLAIADSSGGVKLYHQQLPDQGLLVPVLNQSSATLAEVNALQVVDRDGDGDPDLLLSNAAGQRKLIDNQVVRRNTAPIAPLQGDSSISGNTLTLRWWGASDDRTPEPGLRYNLRVGTAPGASDVLPVTTLDAAALLSAGHHGWNLKIQTAGTFYWSVQAVDSAGASSEWSEERSASALPDLTLAQSSYATSEGDNGELILKVNVNLSLPSRDTVSLDYWLEDGTAVASGEAPDYRGATGQLQIQPGQTIGTISIAIVGDIEPEGLESFVLRLGRVTNARIFDPSQGKSVSDRLNPGIQIPITIDDRKENDGTTAPTLDLTAEALSITSGQSTQPGSRIELLWTQRNRGTASPANQSVATDIWLSKDAVFDSSDRFLTRVNSLVPAADSTNRLQAVLDLPTDLAAGDYNLLVLTNPEGVMLGTGAPVIENLAGSDDPWQNNLSVQNIKIQSIPAADLQLSLPTVVAANTQPLSAQAGGTLGLNLRLNNIGEGALDGTWQLRAFLSQDDQLDSRDVELKPLDLRSQLRAGGQQDLNAQISFLKRDPDDLTFNTWIPTTINGLQRLFLVADVVGTETNLDNNKISLDVTLNGGIARVGFEGWQDQRRPQILTTALPAQSTRSDLMLQADETLQYGSGNRTAGFNGNSIVNLLGQVDQSAPEIRGTMVDGDILTLVFSETLQTLTAINAQVLNQFSITATNTVDGQIQTRTIGVQALNGADNVLVLKLESAVKASDTVTLGYSQASNSSLRIKDTATVANALANQAAIAVSNRTDAVNQFDKRDASAPLISDLSATNVTLFAGKTYARQQGQISFVVNEPLKPGLQPDPQEFVVTGAGNASIPVLQASIQAQRVVLVLQRPITAGETLKLDYRPGDDTADDLQDGASLWAILRQVSIVNGQRSMSKVDTFSSTNLQQLGLEGQNLILNPKANLLAGSSYELELPEGFVADAAGNASAATTLTITTLPTDSDAVGTPQQQATVKTLNASRVEEGNSGSGAPLVSRLRRDGDLTAAQTVRLRLIAAAGANVQLNDITIEGATYDAVNQCWNVAFAPGQAILDLKIRPQGDAIAELDEQIVLELLSDSGVQIVDKRRQSDSGLILNDDRPSNDSWNTAAPLALGTAVTANNRTANGDASEPQLSGGSNQHSLWWGYTAPTNLPGGSRLTISTQGSSFNTRIGLYLASTNGLQEIELNNNGAEDGAARITFQPEAGNTYLIQVDGENGESGNINLQLFSHRLQVIGTQVIEGLDSKARIGIVLDRGILDDQPVTVNYQLKPGTAEAASPGLSGDYSPTPINNTTGQLIFNTFQVAATQINATTGRINLPNHGLQTLDRVLLAGSGTSILPASLQGQTIFTVNVIDANTIELYSTAETKNSTKLVNPGQVPLKLYSLERAIEVSIVDNNENELDESFDLLIKDVTAGGSSGKVLLLNTSGRVTISDLQQSTASLTLSAAVENGQLLDPDPDQTPDSSYTLIGNDHDNQLIGNNQPNLLKGLQGNDLLVSSPNLNKPGVDLNESAVDTLEGGDGDDTYVLPKTLIGRPATVINEAADAGIDTVMSGLPVFDLRKFANIENATVIQGSGGVSGAPISLIGNDLNNRLIGHEGADKLEGGNGNDSLDGGEGVDELIGGAGDDTYTLSDGLLDAIAEAANGGIDTIRSSTSVQLSRYSNVENVVLLDDIKRSADSNGNPIIATVPTAIDAEGDAGDNMLQGSSGDNELIGLSGQDTLIGGDGNDILIGGSGNDSIDGGAGTDTLKLSGNFSDYRIASLGTNLFQLSDTIPNRDGQDTAKDIETYTFKDITLSKDSLLAGSVLNIAATSADKPEGNTGSTTYTFTVTRTGNTSGASSATWTVTPATGSSITANDFVGNSFPTGTVSFPANSTTQTITINVNGDLQVEPDEAFLITLSNPSGANLNPNASSATGTIRNDDTNGTLAIAATSADKPEGNSGTTTYTFTVTRSGNTSGASSATWTVTPATGSSITANDFAGNSFPTGTVSFPANSTSQTITINVNGDLQVEPDEAFLITLSNPSGANLDPNASSATGTIRNDDTNGTLSIAATSADKPEGNTGSTTYTFTVTRTGNTSGASSATWTVTPASGSSITANDFAGNSFPTGTVSFPANITSQTITINVNGDLQVEADEAFLVTLSNPSGANLDPNASSATGTIRNDDAAALPTITLAVSPAAVLENETNNLIYTFTRTGPTNASLTVNYTISGDARLVASGSDPADYTIINGGTSTATSRTVLFSAGQSTATVTID
ncbi:MAG: Calx-beta domain-containing protein, partial [Cyanobacteriota bacterium]